MMERFPTLRRRRLAFTLVELIVVMGIIALMAGLALPAFQRAIRSAQSTKCAGNLRTIGVALTQAASDNNNQYPEISQAASSPYPAGSAARDLYDTLSPYGVTSNILECPTDGTSTGSAYAKYGSSYEWDPAFDDEVTVSPILYVSPTMQIPVNSARVHLCYDFNPIHNGRPNYLYGDGHVRAHN